MATFDIKRKSGRVYTVIVDDADYEHVTANGPWAIVQCEREAYVTSKGGRRLLHRWLLNVPKGMFVGFVNKNGLDCRRENLVVRTPSDHNRERARLHPGNTTGVKGVTWDDERNKWRAYVDHKGKRVWRGYFTSLEAATVARAAALEAVRAQPAGAAIATGMIPPCGIAAPPGGAIDGSIGGGAGGCADSNSDLA